MKLHKSLIFLSIALTLNLFAKARNKDYLKSDQVTKQETKDLEFYNNTIIKEQLARIKFEIIRGNTFKANALLSQAKYTNNFSQLIQYRYMAMSYFIDSNYKKTIEILGDEDFELTSNYKKICSLKTFSYLAMRKFESAKVEWKKCFKRTYLSSNTYNLWLDSFVYNRNFIPSYIRETFKRADNDSLKLILKLSIYLNQQNEVLKYIDHISLKSLADTEIRELIAFSYYKEGKIVKAHEFLKGLNTGNILNIKGNLLLLQKKNEMAYAQFKQAFRKKNTSQNALKRLLPLSWIYKQWDDALIYSSNVVPTNSSNKYFQAAVLVQQKKFKDSNNILLYEVKQKSKLSSSKNINMLIAYNFFNLKKNNKAQSFIEKACLQKDGLSCLYQYHLSYWDNFSEIIKDSKLIKRSELLNTYKSRKITNQLEEKQIINQRNLELLDKQQGYI